ncbi:sugar phosphate isomerase/epimerase family protein [Blastococcus sp. SYSU D00820]
MTTTGQRLVVSQSLWAMEDLPLGGPQWTLPERVAAIADAGFDGLAVDLGARQAPAAADLRPLAEDAGLRVQVFAFVSEQRPLAEALAYAADVGARSMVLCGQVFPAGVAEAAATVRGWLAESSAAGMPVELETHRFTLTNDLHATVALLDAVPELPLAVDLSHYVVGNELPDGPDPRIDPLLDRVLERGTSFQGRIATRGQVQVGPRFPQHAGAVARFRGWWAQGFAAWRARNTADAELSFVCELGTTPYAITGPDGAEISDRWADALLLADWARELFAAAAPAQD